jgi:hypothetical protein
MPDPNIEKLPKETLIQMVKNAPDARLFNSLFVRYKDTGAVKDVCNDGEYSCAFFVSSLLALTGYLEKPHATVAGLRAKMLELPHTKIATTEEILPGDIIFWEKIIFEDGSENEHVGFALGNSRAVSTSFKKQCVVEHDLVVPGGVGTVSRKIISVLRLP